MNAGITLMGGITVDAVEAAARRLWLKASPADTPRIGERAPAVLGSGMDIGGKPGTM
jgi:heptosyltransferase III